MVNPTHGTTTATFTPRDLERYWSKVAKSDGGCWLWLPPVNKGGYGSFGHRGSTIAAHRVGYLIANGEIPEGLSLDHLCRVRNCVNPDHLEPVTPKTNSRRSSVFKTHCSKGHEFTPENTRTYEAQRYCIRCVTDRSRENMRRYRAERRPFAVR